jgi:tripartite-type tricarboxylate transporter receptor subunit TctC
MIKFIISALVSVGMLASAVTVQAAEWKPTQTVKVIVGQGPGAANEIAFRTVLKSAKTDANFVIDHHPGMDGGLSWNHLSSQPADGHTIMVNVVEGSLIVLPNAYPKQLKLNPNNATPVAVLGSAPFAFVVPADSLIKTPRDLVAAYQGKSAKGNISVGISGSGNLLVHSYLMDRGQGEERKVVLARYKAAPQALTDLAANTIDIAIVPISSAKPLVEAGRVRVIAVTSDRPLKAIPTIPVMKDTVPGLVVGATWSMFLPPNTDPKIVKWYADTFSPAVLNAEVRKTFEDQWAVTFDSAGPDHMKKFIAKTKSDLDSVAKKVIVEVNTEKK